MLDNYDVNEDGVIFQLEKSPFNYDEVYAGNYNSYGEIGTRMSYLRLGYLIGGIGKIPESILDIGYGNGSFLETCTKIIPDCNGHDISNYPLPEGCNFITDIFSRFFEVVTFFDSLEHFSDIDWIKNLDCEHIVISLPHCHYFNDQWFQDWKHRKPNEHLWHFNTTSLKKHMNRMGYDCISISNIEDIIRNNNLDEENIISGVFKKR